MHDILEYLLLGLGAGAVYALLANGLVLIYKGSGVLNFAHGGYAMSGAYLFYELHVKRSWPFFPAFLVSVLSVAVVGALTEWLVLRRLPTALAKLIASLGVLAILEGAATVRYGSTVTEINSSLPQAPLRFLGLVVPEDQLWLLLIAVAMAAVLFLLTRYTTVGMVMSAMAEDTLSTSMLGWSPGMVACLTWSGGAAIAAAAGIFVSPLAGLSVTNLILLVIAAMAAALAGGFISFPITLIAALVIGIGQSLMAGYVSTPGASDSLPFLAIILVLVVRGRALPTRADLFERLPRLGSGKIRPVPTVVGAGLVALGVETFFPTGLTVAVTVQIIVAILLLSIVLLTGYAGQLSLGQFALAGAGAVVAGQLVASAHWPFIVALIVGVLGASAVGVVFAIPALRTRGVNLAVVTLGLGVVGQDLIFGNPSLTGGSAGLQVGGSTFLGVKLDPVFHPESYAIFCLVWLVIVAMVVAQIRRSALGRRLVAIRTNERAAASLGISVFRTKIAVFSIAAGIAGLGGILLGFQNESIVFSSYSATSSLNVVGYAVIGGIGHVPGPLLGSGFQSGGIGSYILDRFGSLDPWLTFIGGIFIVATLLHNPEGIAGTFDRRRARRARRAGEGAKRWAFLTTRGGQGEVQASSPPPRPEAEFPVQVAPKHLQVEGLTVSFGGVVAVHSLDLALGPGEVLGLIGPNGAGKSTVIEAITGFVKPKAGRVLLDGRRLDTIAAHQRAAAGVVRSFQGLELFDDLTVRENLVTASESTGPTPRRLLRRWQPPTLAGSALTAVGEFGLTNKLDLHPPELSYGERRLVAIARAVAAAPSILLLDEPAAGLSEAESHELSRLIRRLADEWRMGVLVIEHDIRLVMGTCDRVIAIDFGEKIAEAAPDVLRRDPAVIASYLGEESTEPANDRSPQDQLLVVNEGVKGPDD